MVTTVPLTFWERALTHHPVKNSNQSFRRDSMIVLPAFQDRLACLIVAAQHEMHGRCYWETHSCCCICSWVPDNDVWRAANTSRSGPWHHKHLAGLRPLTRSRSDCEGAIAERSLLLQSCGLMSIRSAFAIHPYCWFPGGLYS